VFTSGIVSTGQSWKIALYFTGRQHAGENLAEVLQPRTKQPSPPIQMCDALTRNIPVTALEGADSVLGKREPRSTTTSSKGHWRLALLGGEGLLLLNRAVPADTPQPYRKHTLYWKRPRCS
jgi:hypothetical protein